MGCIIAVDGRLLSSECLRGCESYHSRASQEKSLGDDGDKLTAIALGAVEINPSAKIFLGKSGKRHLRNYRKTTKSPPMQSAKENSFYRERAQIL